MNKHKITIWAILIATLLFIGVVVHLTCKEGIDPDDGLIKADIVEIAPEQILKAPKEKILANKEIDWIVKTGEREYENKGRIKVYFYASENEVKTEQGEDINQRTRNTKVFPLDEKTRRLEMYSGDPFHKDGDKWYQTEIATSTIEDFNTEVGLISKIRMWLIKDTYADTFYTGAGDGVIFSGYSNTAWDTIHDATQSNQESDVHVTDTTAEAAGVSKYDSASPPDINIRRGFFPIDTSAIGGDTVSDATIQLYVTAVGDSDNDAQGYLVVVGETTQASTASLIRADYNDCGAVDNPDEGSNQVDLTGMATGQYVSWTLNSTGIDWIDGGGTTKFGMREGHDVEDLAINVEGHNRATIYFSEQTGTANDPKLVATVVAVVEETRPAQMIIFD